jgi:hypothetical protein
MVEIITQAIKPAKMVGDDDELNCYLNNIRSQSSH